MGDAIHSMTPFRGVGANVALQDASMLTAKLAHANSTGADPLSCVHLYERQMLDYGFAAVDKSMEMMNRALSEKRPASR